MSARITRHDADRVHGALVAMLGEDFSDRAPWEYRTRDNWHVLISGWHHREGWSRGFTVADAVNPRDMRGYVPAAYDAANRYTGAGWHDRIALDILDAIERMRARVAS